MGLNQEPTWQILLKKHQTISGQPRNSDPKAAVRHELALSYQGTTQSDADCIFIGITIMLLCYDALF